MFNPLSLLRKRYHLRYSSAKLVNPFSTAPGGGLLKLNLGCGEMRLPGWVNIDADVECRPDLLSNVQNFAKHFERESVECIALIHCLNYLSDNDFKIFLKDSYKLLAFGGKIVIESPDILKIIQGIHIQNEHRELAHVIFATDESGPTHKIPYINLWSEKEICMKIEETLQFSIQTENPKTHGARVLRDFRVIATKLRLENDSRD